MGGGGEIEVALSLIPSELILVVKKENSSQVIRDLVVSLDDLASLLNWSFTNSKSLRGLFLAFSSSDLKNSFLDVRIFLL